MIADRGGARGVMATPPRGLLRGRLTSLPTSGGLADDDAGAWSMNTASDTCLRVDV